MRATRTAELRPHQPRLNGVRLFSPQQRRLKGDVKRVDTIASALESEQGMSSALPPVAQKHHTG